MALAYYFSRKNYKFKFCCTSTTHSSVSSESNLKNLMVRFTISAFKSEQPNIIHETYRQHQEKQAHE